MPDGRRNEPYGEMDEPQGWRNELRTSLRPSPSPWDPIWSLDSTDRSFVDIGFNSSQAVYFWRLGKGSESLGVLWIYIPL